MTAKIIWTPELDAALRQFREIGYNLDDCAEKLGIGETPVHKRARELGLNKPLSRGVWTGIVMQATRLHEKGTDQC